MDQVLDHERRYESPSFSALKERKNASNNEPTPSSPLPKALARSFSKVQPRKDPSGNIKLKDIGLLLRERIEAYFKEANIPTVGREWTRCRAVESPIKDQHDLIGPTYIEVIANDPFKPHPASLRSVKHIGVGDLKLAEGQLVDIAGLPVRRAKLGGQALQPAPEEILHRPRSEPVADLLQGGWIFT